jgi:hypothetical protein
MWEAISSESVMTPKEIFFTLQNEGYRVRSSQCYNAGLN